MPGPFENLGAEFEGFAELCAEGVGSSTVTVRQVDPDTGDTLTEAECVTAIKRPRKRGSYSVGAGGQVGDDQCRFILKAGDIPFAMKPNDEIEDGDGNQWDCNTAQLIGFGALWACECVIKR